MANCTNIYEKGGFDGMSYHDHKIVVYNILVQLILIATLFTRMLFVSAKMVCSPFRFHTHCCVYTMACLIPPRQGNIYILAQRNDGCQKLFHGYYPFIKRSFHYKRQ